MGVMGVMVGGVNGDADILLRLVQKSSKMHLTILKQYAREDQGFVFVFPVFHVVWRGILPGETSVEKRGEEGK